MRVLIALLAAVVTLPGFGNIPGAGGFQQWSGMAGANEDRTDYRILISDLLTGQYDHPLRVVAFNPLEGWPPRTWRMNWSKGSLKGTR